MENILIWLGVYLFLIIGLFYFAYRALKTKNSKYGYAIGGLAVLMVLMFFL